MLRKLRTLTVLVLVLLMATEVLGQNDYTGILDNFPQSMV